MKEASTHYGSGLMEKNPLLRAPHPRCLGPPTCRPSKIICIGVNYRDHATESGAELPREPVVFMKATSSLVGPNDPVVIPKNAKKLDWEVELAVVIGKRAAYIRKQQAVEFVAGYALEQRVPPKKQYYKDDL